MEIAPRLEGRRERVKQFVTNRVFGGMSRCMQWTSFFQHFNGSGPCMCIGPPALDLIKFFEMGTLSQKFQWYPGIEARSKSLDAGRLVRTNPPSVSELAIYHQRA